MNTEIEQEHAPSVAAERACGTDDFAQFVSQPSAIALCYHDVYLRGDESRLVGVDERHYSVAADALEGHVAATGLFRLGERTRDPTAPRRTVLFTFDDGWESAATVVAPILERANLRGAFFITTGMVGCKGFLSREQIRSLHANGHIVGSHTHTHPDFIDRCPRSIIRREWGTSIAVLQDLVGSKVNTASVPSGAYSAEVAEVALECGIEHLFTSRPGLVSMRAGTIAVYPRFSITSQTTISDVSDCMEIGPRRLRVMQMKWDAKRAASRWGGAFWMVIRRALLRARQ